MAEKATAEVKIRIAPTTSNKTKSGGNRNAYVQTRTKLSIKKARKR